MADDFAEIPLECNAGGYHGQASDLLDEALDISRSLGMRLPMESVLSSSDIKKA